MSRGAELNLFFADGEHTFRLPIGGLRELQDKCGAGPQAIFNRLASGNWLIDDVIETLRIGLIGGGMSPVDAAKLVERYVVDGTLQADSQVATQIVLTALIGTGDDEG